MTLSQCSTNEVDRLIGRLIGLPERLQEVGIVTKPSFPLNKVEEHTAVEELQGVIVRPLAGRWVRFVKSSCRRWKTDW